MRLPKRTLTDYLGTPILHNIQAIRVQARETEQLSNTLEEHHDHRKCHAPKSLLDTPSVDDHASWHGTAQEHEAASKTILSNAFTADSDVLLDDVIGIPATEEGSEEVSTAWSNIE